MPLNITNLLNKLSWVKSFFTSAVFMSQASVAIGNITKPNMYNKNTTNMLSLL